MRFLLVIATSIMLLASCSSGDNQQAKIAGIWNLTAVEGHHDLEECEKSMNFNFTNEATDAGGKDGWVLRVTQGEKNPCDMIGPNDDYESSYTFVEGKLYIRNLRLMGGDNYSGIMTIQEMTDKKMVIKTINTTLFFSKAS